MGNTDSCGIGVINRSTLREINIGLSMCATHNFENGVEHGEIFYRWPGAVFYTVYAFARKPDKSNDIIYGQVSVSEDALYCEQKGCYGGANGTWLIIEGGPETDAEGFIRPNGLKIKFTTFQEVMNNGNFTRYSHAQYHTKPGLPCSPNCPYCRRE